ncbi:MAG: hypothetical protein CSB46_09735, partial [Micrococcales bacterium]
MVSYHQLWRLVADARQLVDAGTARLIQLPMSNDLDAIIAYLATLASRSVALITHEDGVDDAGVVARFQPNAVWRNGDLIERDAPGHVLHPELAALLSTSGSTGSTKLVRLSHGNLVANADAIAAALNLTGKDRGITSLPLHYCYGLSVLNSHLRAGACVVVTNGSVINEDFWDEVRNHEVTDLAVVPLMAQLIASRGGIPEDLPKLRLITQAGGKLEPHEVAQWDQECRHAGRDFCVMYGQTEATARMTLMPPAKVRDHPDAVGYPIADSTVHLEPVDDMSGLPPAAGELVFSGPGVMLGYAEHPDDLALGHMVDQLHTGDLATIDASGLVRIVGRRSEFCKIAGLRIDIHRVQAELTKLSIPAVVAGDDESLAVAIDASRCAEKPPEMAEVRSHVAEAAGLDLALVQAALLSTLPTLPNGKADRKECLRLVRAISESDAELSAVDPRWWRLRRRDTASALARILGKDSIDTSVSFVANGGNSLNHSQHTWFIGLETSVVLRALAVITIASNHTGATALIGGAHALLTIAGYNFARFTLTKHTPAARWWSAVRTMASVAIPTSLVALYGVLVTGSYKWSNVVLLQWILGPQTRGRHRVFWFIESYLTAFCLAAVIFAIPQVMRWYRSRPWATAISITLIAIIPKTYAVSAGLPRTEYLPWVIMWMFTLGIAIAHAHSWPQKLASFGVLTVGMYHLFDTVAHRSERYAYVVIAIALLTLVANVRIPRLLAVPAQLLASASLFVYILQFDLFYFMKWLGSEDRWSRFIGAVILATAIWWAFNWLSTA